MRLLRHPHRQMPQLPPRRPVPMGRTYLPRRTSGEVRILRCEERRGESERAGEESETVDGTCILLEKVE